MLRVRSDDAVEHQMLLAARSSQQVVRNVSVHRDSHRIGYGLRRIATSGLVVKQV